MVFSFASFLFCIRTICFAVCFSLLAKEIIVTTLAEIAIVATVCIVDMYEFVTSLASHEELRSTFFADVHVAVLIRFILWHGLATILTFNGFHI